MYYPKPRSSAAYRWVPPQPDGGICRSVEAHAIGERQLSDGCNVEFRDGRLRTRPVLSPVQTYDTSALGADGTLSDIRLYCGEGAPGPSRQQLMATFTPENGKHSYAMIGVGSSGALNSDPPLLVTGCPADSHAVWIESEGKSDRPMLMTDGSFYIKAGTGLTVQIPYTPTLAVRAVGGTENLPAEPGGYSYESRNLLTDAFRIDYVVTDGALYFHLPPDRALSGTLRVGCTDTAGSVCYHFLSVSGTGISHEAAAGSDGLQLYYSGTTRCFWLCRQTGDTAQAVTPSAATLSAVYAPQNSRTEGYELIAGMRFGTWFGGDRAGLTGGSRLFLAGHPDHPHLIRYSALNDPSYFPENSYLYAGTASDPITAFGRQGRMLVVFKQHEIYYMEYSATALRSEQALAGGIVDAETQSAVFPLTPLSSGIGCDCPRSIRLCRDRLLWATSDGSLHTLIAGSAYSQCNVRTIGTDIAPLLRECGAEALRQAFAVWDGERYLLFAGSEVFLCGNLGESAPPAWYRWHMPCGFLGGYAAEGAVRLIGSVGGTLVSYRLTEGGADVIYEPGDTQPQAVTHTLSAEFSTPLWDGGRPDCRKHIRQVTLQGEGQRVWLRTRDEHGEAREEWAVSYGTAPILQFSPGCRRVYRFGLRCRTEGQAAFDGMSLRGSLYER